MSARVTLDSVGKHFPGAPAPAVADVSLDVAAGSCTAILGPSGSGKSTVLRLIAGLELPDSGRVLLGGHDVRDVVAERRGVGMVFQKPLLFPHLDVLDNVAFAERVRGAGRAAARARAAEYLEMVQLGGFGARRVGELSGGQEQRVAIARALAAQPAVLLLDEPFSALDPALRADMHALIDDVRLALAPTIVLVTHDRDEAAAVADRIAVLEQGRLLHESSVADAYRRPRTLQVARLMGGRNELPGVVRDGLHHSAAGCLPVPEGTPDGPGVLVVRQEDLVVCDVPASGGAARATVGRSDAATAPSDGGAGAASARRLQPAADRDVPATAPYVVVGEIESVRVLGARSDVRVRCAPDLLLHAELPAGHGRRLGDRVGLVVPCDATHVVRG